MAHQFIKVGIKAEMINAVVEDKKIWLFCSPEVKAYAKNTFKEGDLVDFTYEKQSDNSYKITSKITKAGNVDVPVEKPAETSVIEEKPKVVETPIPLTNTSSSGISVNYSVPVDRKSDNYNRGMRNGNLINAVAASLVALQGQVTPANIHQIIKDLHKTYSELPFVD